MSCIKHQKIRFQEGPNNKSMIELADELKGIKGVHQVSIDFQESNVSVEYDLLKVSQHDIENKMVKIGFALDNGFWQKFKRGWAHFTEENERDNLTTNPHSCCEDPTQQNKRKPLK
jgi:copper chaperone CopZ